MFSVGVLAFLFAEVLSHGIEIMEEQFEHLGEGERARARRGPRLAFMLGAGFTAGSAGLALLERRMRPTSTPPPIARRRSDAMTVEHGARRSASVDGPARAARCASG